MEIEVQFFSYFKDLTGVERCRMALPAGSTLGELQDRVAAEFPPLAALRRSTLMAVGVEYQDRRYVLKEGDEVSFFPPVQGG